MTTTNKLLLSVTVLAAILFFPLTAKFAPVTKIAHESFDASKVYQFGGKGFFHSNAKLTRINENEFELKDRTNQLPEATVDAWIEDQGIETVTPAYAHAQAKRISETLAIPLIEVNRLIDELTVSNFIGGDSVSVQKLNMAIVQRQERNL